MSKGKVALALSSGGPRGFAYIGAIEEILRRGYEISSIAGSSAGSLVGGVYAAGGLEAFKEWLFALDPLKVMRLMDFSLSRNYLVKGDRVIKAIKASAANDIYVDYPIVLADTETTDFDVIYESGRVEDKEEEPQTDRRKTHEVRKGR